MSRYADALAQAVVARIDRTLPGLDRRHRAQLIGEVIAQLQVAQAAGRVLPLAEPRRVDLPRRDDDYGAAAGEAGG